MTSYETVTEAVNDLTKKGYTANFNKQEDGTPSGDYEKISQSPESFQIDEVYRFEGETDPADEAIVIAISSAVYELKGILVNGYGIYDDAATSDIIKSLLLNEKNIAYRHQFE